MEPVNQNLEQQHVVEPVIQPTALVNWYKIVVTGVILITIVGVGAYYIGTRRNNSTSQVPTTFSSITTEPSPLLTDYPDNPELKNITWQAITVQIKKETETIGKETINLSIQIPTDWILTTVPNDAPENAMIKNCADYVLSDNSHTAKLTISQFCDGWAASYIDWPSSATSIKEENNVGIDNHTNYLVRYVDSVTNQYKYVDGEKSSSKISDAVIITYNPSTNNFLPLAITLENRGINIEQLLKIVDQIVISLKAQ